MADWEDFQAAGGEEDHTNPTYDESPAGAHMSDAISGRRDARENAKLSNYKDTGNNMLRTASNGLAMAKAKRP